MKCARFAPMLTLLFLLVFGSPTLSAAVQQFELQVQGEDQSISTLILEMLASGEIAGSGWQITNWTFDPETHMLVLTVDGDSFTIDSLVGQLPEGAILFGGDGDVVIGDDVLVPIPGTFTFFVSALSFLVLLRKRRI